VPTAGAPTFRVATFGERNRRGSHVSWASSASSRTNSTRWNMPFRSCSTSGIAPKWLVMNSVSTTDVTITLVYNNLRSRAR
jgi:hypothetical protein